METSSLTDARKTSAEEEHFSRFISIFSFPGNSFGPFSLYPAIPAATTVMGNLGRTIFFWKIFSQFFIWYLRWIVVCCFFSPETISTTESNVKYTVTLHGIQKCFLYQSDICFCFFSFFFFLFLHTGSRNCFVKDISTTEFSSTSRDYSLVTRVYSISLLNHMSMLRPIFRNTNI